MAKAGGCRPLNRGFESHPPLKQFWISRSAVKYGLRAYPYSLIEAGHIGQNICLKCAELGVGCCPVSGFVDEEIVKLLDLTEYELPVYSISIGYPAPKV